MDEALYRKYGPALLRKAERLLGNRADAEDVVQALFSQLLYSGETRGVDLPYLFRATTHRCLNVLRDRSRQAELLAQQEPALRGPVRTRCEDRVIDLDLLTRLMRRLDDKVCAVLVYHFFDDLTQEEVAALAGLSRRTVGKYLQRIRDTLSQLSEGEAP